MPRPPASCAFAGTLFKREMQHQSLVAQRCSLILAVRRPQAGQQGRHTKSDSECSHHPHPCHLRWFGQGFSPPLVARSSERWRCFDRFCEYTNSTQHCPSSGCSIRHCRHTTPLVYCSESRLSVAGYRGHMSRSRIGDSSGLGRSRGERPRSLTTSATTASPFLTLVRPPLRQAGEWDMAICTPPARTAS